MESLGGGGIFFLKGKGEAKRKVVHSIVRLKRNGGEEASRPLKKRGKALRGKWCLPEKKENNP